MPGQQFDCPHCGCLLLMFGNLMLVLNRDLYCPHCHGLYRVYYEVMDVDESGFFYIEKGQPDQ